MAPTGVRIVEQAFEAWNHDQMDRLIALIDEHAVMKHPRGWPEPGPSKGRAQIRRQFEMFNEGFGTVRLSPREFRTVGDRVVVPTEMRSSGVASGAEITAHFTYVFKIERSLMTRLDLYAEDELLPEEVMRV